tara:strand:- start:1512 stop:1637 length:126 start_codon:yes stop_codon:yes gene_type:complete
MLIIAFGIKRKEKDEDKKFFYTNHKAKVGMGDLVKRGIFLT